MGKGGEEMHIHRCVEGRGGEQECGRNTEQERGVEVDMGKGGEEMNVVCV